jgi:hypothetical protein
MLRWARPCGPTGVSVAGLEQDLPAGEGNVWALEFYTAGAARRWSRRTFRMEFTAARTRFIIIGEHDAVEYRASAKTRQTDTVGAELLPVVVHLPEPTQKRR